MLTTIWQKLQWHTDGILITEEKFLVRTHHNALRFTSVSHLTAGLAQASPNYHGGHYGICAKARIRDESPQNDPALKRSADMALIPKSKSNSLS